MGRSVALAGGRPAVVAVVAEMQFESAQTEGELGLEGGRRIAVAALLALTGMMFTTPPAIAVLVLAGIVR